MTPRMEFPARRKSGHAWRLATFSGAVLLCACQSLSRTSPAPPTAASATRESAVRPVNYEEPAAVAPAESRRGAAETLSDADPSRANRPAAPAPPLASAASPPVVCEPPIGSCPPSMAPPAACGAPAFPPVWSPNEYVCDGGDAFPNVAVARDSRVFGLGEEDTVAHYDTVDGHTYVQPSNRVCVYAPRFAAVRSVTGMVQHEQHQWTGGLAKPVGPEQSGTAELATTVLQPVQPRGQQAVKFGQMFRERSRTEGIENLQALATARDELLPFEDFLALQRGQFDNAEKARLAARLEAAVVWSHDQAVQVAIDNVQAVESSNHLDLQSVYTYEMPKGKPRLCLAKCASTATAKSGDVVRFTIRFQNVGDQRIGNVTILDNLSSRLELVAGSEQCSLPAKFSKSENDSESFVLRWEVTEPLRVGEGGVIHFECRMR